MAKRPHPRGASTNPALGPWSACDYCGFQYSQSRLQFQYDYTGGSVPTNLGWLVCETCLDSLNFQRKLLILPPDPAPIFNTRPENYTVDATNWITTQDGSIITTQDGSLFTPSIPNPADNANTVNLTATLAYPAGSITALYLDLFDGNPLTSGRSVLTDITGSATRTDIAASMQVNTSNQAVNTSAITITAATPENPDAIPVSYVAFYTAASGGSLLVSGPLGASPTVSGNMAVQFAGLALVLQL